MPVLTPAYTFRRAVAADAEGLARLAALDGQRALRGRVFVVAEGEALAAAYSLDEFRVVADPARIVTVVQALIDKYVPELTPGAARLVLRYRLAALAGNRGIEPSVAAAPRPVRAAAAPQPAYVAAA